MRRPERGPPPSRSYIPTLHSGGGGDPSSLGDSVAPTSEEPSQNKVDIERAHYTTTAPEVVPA